VLAALRLILAGTFDRHPDLHIILGHWGKMLVSFADRADALTKTTHLERRGPRLHHRKHLRHARSRRGFARAFVETAPISAEDKSKLAHLNAERRRLVRA
jgi:hypothetical protein